MLIKKVCTASFSATNIVFESIHAYVFVRICVIEGAYVVLVIPIKSRHLKWIIFVRPFGQLSPCSGIRISVYSYHLDTHPLSVQILPEFEIIKYSKNKR